MIARKITLGILAASLLGCRPISPLNSQGEQLVAPTSNSCNESFDDGMLRNGFQYNLEDGLYVFDIEKGKGFTVRKVDQFAEIFDESNIEITVTGGQSIIRFVDTTGEIIEIPLSYYYRMELPDHLRPMDGLDVLHFTMDIYEQSGLNVGGSYFGCTSGEPL